MSEVAIVYHIMPHYRTGVCEALDSSSNIDFTFYATDQTYNGIVPLDGHKLRHFVRAPFRWIGPTMWQWGAVAASMRPRPYDAVVFLCDSHFVTTWLAAIIARLRGIPVLFWGHGWLRPETTVKRLLRHAFYRLSDHILVYARRGARLGIEAGFPASRITVVYNSLDLPKADAIFARIESGALASIAPQSSFAQPDRPLLICTARLTPLCRFDLLIEAAALLAERGRPVNVLLVGDGSERANLEALAAQRGVDVHFAGACYDEDVLGQYIYHADLTVSPGKIGLTAMHTLMYGTPAITHDDFDNQMPEVEAILPGQTGDVFTRGSAPALADAIERWLAAGHVREDIRQACRAEIHARWRPDLQAQIIEQVLAEQMRNA